MRRLILSVVFGALGAALLPASPASQTTFFPIDDVRPGMVGTGRTVFAGDTLSEFKATIIGVLRNVMGPRRDLILARLEGGPLANTGVMQGMSGSPVFIDGKLLGAVSYSLGSFPKEPLAGITPIAEMVAAVDGSVSRSTTGGGAFDLRWPATSDEVFAAFGRLAARAAAPLNALPSDVRAIGPVSMLDLAPSLRPIGAAMVLSGFDPRVDRDLRAALASAGPADQNATANRPASSAPTLRPGDAVGMGMLRGDTEMGATGTVTWVDGTRVYGFGHPFLNLGSTAFAMTKAQVYTVLPSLDTSMKIATLGPVIGVMDQDRSTAVGGTLGAPPKSLDINLTLQSERGGERKFSFQVIQDPSLTALFTYVAVLNSVIAYERQTGMLAIGASGTLSFGADGSIAIDDYFSGDGAITSVAGAIATPVGVAVANEFKRVTPERLDVTLKVAERTTIATIERVWLDTVKPKFGATHTLQVQLRDFRGVARTISMPVTMPVHADGPVTLLVTDGTGLATLEQRDIKPGKPASWPALLNDLTAARRGNRIYVRLITSSAGTVVAGETLPALPGSVRSVLDADATVGRAPVSKTVVGAWEQRLDAAVKGSREMTFTLSPRGQ